MSLPVIASVAKQSRGYVTRPLDCFVASLLAMTGSAIVAALAARGRRRAPQFLSVDQAGPTPSATASTALEG